MSILVPLDKSDLARSALPLATEIAGGIGEDLLLITVADARARHSIAELAATENQDPIDIFQANLRSAAAETGDVPAQTDVLGGKDAASVIIERAARDDVRMVVLASHGRSGYARWRMGSVAERVMRGATVPVLVVPAPWRRKIDPSELSHRDAVTSA